MFPNSTIQARRVSLFSPLILAVTCSAQTWTEARVLDVFAQQSPRAVAVRAQVAVTRADARGRSLYSDPSFSYSRQGAGLTQFFQAGQTLPITGRIGILRQTVAPAAGAVEAEADALVWQLRAKVGLAYHRLLALQVRESVLDPTLKDMQEVNRSFASLPTLNDCQGILPVVVRNPQTGKIYAVNTAMPKADLSPFALKVLSELPSLTGAGRPNNYEQLSGDKAFADKFDAKIDGQIKDRMSAFLRISQTKRNQNQDSTFPGPSGGNGTALWALNQQAASAFTWATSPTSVLGTLRCLPDLRRQEASISRQS
ncbi:MAG TPA: hypothetical protein VGK29_02785 [Paludibaculum sp.]|jgi:hypothetical protein